MAVVYSRRMGNNTFTFEPSGGLLNASLVMMDKETDSHWSIITEEAVWGKSKGTRLEQIPGAVKTTWGDWHARHPESLVLSVGNIEHDEEDPYTAYFTSEDGFRKIKARDGKLPDKAHIYAFHWAGGTYAVPQSSFHDGGVVKLGDREIFLYRTADDSHYQSTSAFISAPGSSFEGGDGAWSIGSAQWNVNSRSFEGEDPPEVFSGFDTFWYVWSLTNEGTELLTTTG